MSLKGGTPMPKDSGPIKSAANEHNNSKNPLSQKGTNKK